MTTTEPADLDVSEILASADPARYGYDSPTYDRTFATIEDAWTAAHTRAGHGARSWITDRAHPAACLCRGTTHGTWVAPYRVTGADVPRPAGALLVIVHPHTEAAR